MSNPITPDDHLQHPPKMIGAKADDSQDGRIQKHFEANMLDGEDAANPAQMLSSAAVLEYIQENFTLKQPAPKTGGSGELENSPADMLNKTWQPAFDEMYERIAGSQDGLETIMAELEQEAVDWADECRTDKEKHGEILGDGKELSRKRRHLLHFIQANYIPRSEVAAAIEDTTAFKDRGIVWIDYKELKGKLGLDTLGEEKS